MELVLLFKSLHFIFLIAWFAGLFYMFRLYVYHVENTDKPDFIGVIKVMEHKLYYYITVPAMVLTISFGSLLLYFSSTNITDLWILKKLTFVALLVGYNLYIGHTLKRFKKDDIFLTSKQCRIINEVPTIMLISIIFIAVFRYY